MNVRFVRICVCAYIVCVFHTEIIYHWGKIFSINIKVKIGHITD